MELSVKFRTTPPYLELAKHGYLTIIAGVVAIIADIVQVLDYIQKRNQKQIGTEQPQKPTNSSTQPGLLITKYHQDWGEAIAN
ncbi:hypothetical protein I8748_13015 [Nostoc sp. CENA67]|uniref:Uncharacterized protein n=1 Tax=Amazonocrinis nigriterrae CENA67 TaxID=2794033 RepID=A0A8J7LAW3_9NOST|nr:hypothetical protein [Amazonocrinis nigriterrae]MBH8563091.1 hypothetical protein [Amazonocrinis nigriterrae CENA67]